MTEVTAQDMQTWDYNQLDRYPPGPWTGEPDKAQWIDPATGMDCLIVRNGVGSLCGYVGVPPEHPWHGVGYSQCLTDCGKDYCYEHTPEMETQVHGGLTFASGCDEDHPEGICHVPRPGRPADVWWFGFDCAHAGDLTPGTPTLCDPKWTRTEVYRNVAYVQQECASLAAQLVAVSS